MRTFSIDTLGCKVNQYESQQIREFLEFHGLTQITPENKPELCIINTCCVTHTASAKSRQSIHKAQKAHPDAIFVICGCLPSVNIGEINELGQSNVYVIRNRNNLVGTLTRILAGSTSINSDLTTENIKIKPENTLKIKDKSPNLTELPHLSAFRGRTRAFLKVQDGCDGSCSYCIIPKARPVLRSKPLEQVLEEAQALADAGHKEIVVTGIFLGAFGRDTVRRKKWPTVENEKLCELLEKLAKIPNLKRIRLSSIEPADVTERLMDTFCSNPNIMPHIHLSIQSGSDSILKKMCRQYRLEDVYKSVELLNGRLDRPAITCDLIVGFPGETDSDFEKTVELAKGIKFAKMHIFSFSPRKGTSAYDMKPKVHMRIIKERSQILRSLDKQLRFQFRQQFLGQQQVILTESCDGDRQAGLSGRTERYFVVRLQSHCKGVGENQLVKVELTENKEDGMLGRFVGLV